MSISINGIEINGSLIENFKAYLGSLVLSGKAKGDEGKQICGALTQFKKGDTVHIEDFYKFEFTGNWKIEGNACSFNSETQICSFSLGFSKASR